MANTPVTTVNPASISDASGYETPAVPGFFTPNLDLEGGSPPIITNYVPPLTTELGPFDTRQFDVIDDGTIKSVTVIAEFTGLPFVETIYLGGFRKGYEISSSVEILGVGWRRFRIRRNGGFPERPFFEAHAVDNTGQLNA